MTVITHEPEITLKGTTGKTTVTAKADVGADRTTIDHKVAARIGAGPVVSSVKVNGADRRPVVRCWVECNDVEELLEVSLSDRSDRSTDALLGKPFLQNFSVQVEA